MGAMSKTSAGYTNSDANPGCRAGPADAPENGRYYVVELPSRDSTCKHCDQKILKSTLRAVRRKVKFINSKAYYHLQCIKLLRKRARARA